MQKQFFFNKNETEQLLKKYPQFCAFYLEKNNKYIKSNDLTETKDFLIIKTKKNFFIQPFRGGVAFLSRTDNGINIVEFKKSQKIKNIYLNNKRQLLYINGEYRWRYNGKLGQNVYLEKRSFCFNEK